MDNRKTTSNPNPRESANILSVLTWTWTYKMFEKSYSEILDVDDLYDPVSTDRSNLLGDRLEKQWFAELERAKKKKGHPSFLWALCRSFAPALLVQGSIHFFVDLVFRLAIPMFLGALLRHFKPESTTTYESAIHFAIAIVVTSVINVVLSSQIMYFSNHTGGCMRIATCSVVYRKALRLSITAFGETAPGKVVNLVANDVNRFEVVLVFIHYMWSAPLATIIIMAILYSEVGWSAFVGVFLIFLVVPFQGYLGKLSSKFRLQTALKTDERVRLMDEIISGVQVIKMYAWEKPFCAMVALARRLELKVVRKSSYVRAIFMTFFLFTTRMALYGTLMTMMFRGQELAADRVFMYMSYFNLISMTMSGFFVRGIAEIAECSVSVARLQNFLMLEEFESEDTNKQSNGYLNGVTKFKNNVTIRADELLENGSFKINDKEFNHGINKHEEINENLAVKLNHVTAKWDLHSTETTLDDIDVEIGKGKLYIVIGIVGAGKSSLISTILGELKLLQGSSEVKGSISYADQDAWVFGASVRQNILFGQKYDRQRYQTVVRVCALEKDFQQFPKGDLTIVGERGSSLSGGQKARINLARAVYRQADIYLLDDPLSAVDAHVGKHLFEECLQKYLAGKTRILATHQLQFIKAADTILLLDQGKVYKFTDYHELLQAHPEYNTLIAEEEKEMFNEEIVNYSNGERRFSSTSLKSRMSTDSGKFTDGEEDAEENKNESFYEGPSRGTVEENFLLNYIRSGASNIGILLLFILFIGTQFSVMLHDSFIPILVNAEESWYHRNQLHKNNSLMFDFDSINSTKSTTLFNSENPQPRVFYMYIYTAIVASIFVICITRSFRFYQMCLGASQRLHDLVFGSLIRTTMRFFDTNPSGRILNRFSKDLGAIDETLAKALLDSTNAILTIIGAIIVVCTVNIYFLIPTMVIGGMYLLIRRIYLKTSRNIKRLEGTTRAPVFTHLNATLNGITTIRACRAEGILKQEFDKLQDIHTSSWYMYVATSVAFAFSLDVCSLIFTGIVTFSFLLLKNNFNSGEVGLGITQVMSLTGLLQWGMRQSAEVANQLVSVERILEYSQLPSEPNLRDKGIAKKKKCIKGERKETQLVEPPQSWPDKGLVECRSMSLYYTEDDPPVLKNLSLIIKPSEKVGVVGRTGAGKSSLISALFRLAKVEGVIAIDGIDTGTIALEDLRKNMSIIPQDPILFSGTLRRNLDPFNEFSDERLWEVLEEVELKDFINNTGNGLNYRVLNRGLNYSTGQRQLICLARAILRNNRILMLDEATANVDPHTDALIQRTIRTKFAQCSVLTVAHRLNTIMDSDRVLVMDKGCLVEFDHPYILLQNEQGSFSLLVKETGQTKYEQLRKVARDAYNFNASTKYYHSQRQSFNN